MKVLSVCSGIGAAELAWTRLGWTIVATSDIEPFPNAVRAYHWPDVPNWGDITKYQEWPDANVNVLVGGTPCQSFSVAGLRKGLADDRGNLARIYLEIARRYRPEWLVWENVSGVLSSNGGRDFGSILGGMGELGYGFAYRVLDAQFFGVAQRRRRVFVVGYAGDWRRAAAVLFERESLSGHPAPRREAGKDFTHDVAPGFTGSGRGRGQDPVVAQCVTTRTGLCCDPEHETLIAHTLRGEGFDASEDGTGRGTPLVAARMDAPSTANVSPTPRGMLGQGPGRMADDAVAMGMVRRLTPRECERLQGFPDDWTLVPYRGKPAADSPRYRAIGNSMAVPVMEWIGRRIDMVSALATEAA